MGTKPWQNSEGYSDPTAYEGLKPVIREDEEQQRRLNNLIFVLKYIIRLAGFELLNRIGPNSDTGKGTLYINGEPLAEVGEIKIPLEVEPSDLPPILANVSFTITMDCPRWLRRKLAWWIFKARLKDLIHRIFHF